ncbi:MAG: hypothetical protein Edafosvirus6_24 [Edafosvirus sp.]|uniref:Uncharacterized protein n=1 Tax=Edafosvirus sp. TaxID=2487765 RepID=A0A3G4ZTF3_9VIRU|nr:MAG: hypothetical protein Edafosvirus6_24 [Edafosvirus sp.]
MDSHIENKNWTFDESGVATIKISKDHVIKINHNHYKTTIREIIQCLENKYKTSLRFRFDESYDITYSRDICELNYDLSPFKIGLPHNFTINVNHDIVSNL